MAANINLFLALIWLILGLGGLAWNWLDPVTAAQQLGGSGITTISYAALAMFLYNMVRFWAQKKQQRRRQEQAQEEIRLVRLEKHAEEYLPEFDFKNGEKEK
jgi:hypothetical protein